MSTSYLVCTFPGGDHMHTREFPFEPVDRVLERARGLSYDDDLLWAVALRLDERTIWLSGADYTQVPQTFSALDARYHMQNRYLLKRWITGDKPALLPDGRRVVSFDTEHGWGPPLWQPGGGQIGTDDLALSKDLADDLDRHQRDFMRHLENPAPIYWRERVRDLYIRLCDELKDVAEVRLDYRPRDPLPLSLHTYRCVMQRGSK